MKKLKRGLVSLFVGTSLATGFMLTSCGNNGVKVDFNIDGEITSDSKYVTAGENVSLPTLTKEGYVFSGWYDNPECTGSPVESLVASANVTLYAKWLKAQKVNLNLNGATLSTNSIFVAVGEKLSTVVSGLIPTKTGLEFAGWYLNGKLLTNNDIMPDSDVTLEAKFNQEYTVEYYASKVGSSSEYELYSSETKKALVGSTVSAEDELDGFKLSASQSNVKSITISENKNSNVLKLYFDRESYEINFKSNYPIDDSEEETVKKNYVYGQKINFPTSFTCDGYEIVGWARSATGRIAYYVNNIDNNVYNSDGTEESTSYLVERSGDLYAVWQKAYTDLRGGSDEIYILDVNNKKSIYLKRDGIYFKGKLDTENNSFNFYNESTGDYIISGKIINDENFLYADDETKGIQFKKYDTSTGESSDSVFIQLDEFDGIKYTTKNEDGSSNVSSGTYTISNYVYEATFTSGPLAGKTVQFQVGYVGNVPCFLERNEDEVALGVLPVYQLVDYKLSPSTFNIALDGYSGTTFNSKDYNYLLYTDEDTNEEYVFLYSGQTLAYSFKFVEVDGKKALVLYNSSSRFEATVDNTTISLDGCYTATITTGSTTKTGVYNLEQTAFGDCILDIKVSDDEFYRYIVNANENESGDISYDLASVSVDYKEYYYLNKDNIYQAPLFVLDSNNTATMYGYTEQETFVKVTSGTYTYDSKTEMYSYTATQSYAEGIDAISELMNLNDIKSVKFKVTTTDNGNATYWYSYVTKSDKEVNLVEKYSFTGNDSSKYVQFVGNKMEYFDGEKLVEVEYQEDESLGITAFLISDDKVLYFYYNEDGTVTFCQYPTTLYLYVDNNANKDVTLSTDKFGVETYSYLDGDNTVSVKGSSSQTGDISLAGYNIYEFTSEDKSVKFKYIIASSSSTYYFLQYNEDFNGTYSYTNNSVSITLDGFGMYALVSTSQGNDTYGYYISKDGDTYQIILTNSSYEFAFNIIDSQKHIEMVGIEKGEYIVLDNQNEKYKIKFDGFNNAVVYEFDENGDLKLLDDAATYSSDNEDLGYVVKFKNGNDVVSIAGNLFTYGSSSSETVVYFIISHTDVMHQYVDDEDWSILDLDQYGNAKLYTKNGSVENGIYRIISDDLLFYLDSNQANPILYSYDLYTGNVVKNVYDEHGYFTNDFDSLVFYSYGVVTSNNSEVYYTIDKYESVTLYTFDPYNKDANDYGFVESEFGTLDSIKSYEGKDYYLSDGISIPFDRSDANKNLYPLLQDGSDPLQFGTLNFTPTGKEFNVTGRIRIGNDSYSCTVVREAVKNDKDEVTGYKSYVMVNNYKLDVSLTYGMQEDGDSSATYEVTGLTFVDNYKSSDYLSLLELLYEYTQQDYSNYVKNTYGGITFYDEISETGKAIRSYVSSDLALDYVTDSLGNYLTFEEAEYTVVSMNGSSVFIVSTKGKDNQKYNLYLSASYFTKPSKAYGINVTLVTRTFEKETTNGYKVEVEEIVSINGNTTVEGNENIGGIAGVNLAKKDADGKYNDISISDSYTDSLGNYYVISREFKEETNGSGETVSKLVGTKYYKIDVTVDETTEKDKAPMYTDVAVTEVDVNTYYDADASNYLDVTALDNKLMQFVYKGSLISVSSYTYDAATKTYTIVSKLTNETKTYTVVIGEDGVPTITVVSQAN